VSAELARQAALHLGARLASVGLSFVLFAWVGRVLQPGDAARAYAFVFGFGFLLATARLALQLGAAVVARSRTTQRMRRALAGLALLRWMMAPLALAAALVGWMNSGSWLVAACAAGVAVLAAADIDLLRGILGRSAVFAPGFALGSLLSLALLHSVLPHTLMGAIACFLLQWVPLCLMNLRVIRRLWRRMPALAEGPGALAVTLLLACFDGLVLNAPFLGIAALPVPVTIELSVVMRVFVASLPLLPLLLHWSNSPGFTQLCERFGLGLQGGFMATLGITGALAGLLFLAAYATVSQQPVSLGSALLYLALLAGYALYAPQMRFVREDAPARFIAAALGAALSCHAAGLAILLRLGLPGGASAWVLWQAATLAGTALALRFAIRSNARTSSRG